MTEALLPPLVGPSERVAIDDLVAWPNDSGNGEWPVAPGRFQRAVAQRKEL
jgi:hypothetical protein